MGAGPQLEAALQPPAWLAELCRACPDPIGVADAAGVLVASSPALDELRASDPAVDRAIASSIGLASSHRRTCIEAAGGVLELAPLDGTLLVRVRMFGPPVVRVRLSRLNAPPLSGREMQCLSLALEGRDNAEIALRLGVRPETVKVHLRHAYRKLDTTGRTALLARLVPGA